jgi:RHS repeat-associated protein
MACPTPSTTHHWPLSIRFTYDQNDLGPLTGGTSASTGAFTPKSETIDALERTIKTTEHNSQPTSNPAAFEDVVMKYKYDIRGNLLQVLDPYDRVVFRYKYDLRPPQKNKEGKKEPLPPLWTNHIDSGISRVVYDAMGKPIHSSDAKGAETLSSYDRLQRTTYGWAIDEAGLNYRMVLRNIYGKDSNHPLYNNLYGKLWRSFDEAGRYDNIRFDFKGNQLRGNRQVIRNSNLKNSLDNYEPYRVDWKNTRNKLSPTDYKIYTTYDALNRVKTIRLPEDINGARKFIVPHYNRAGAIERIEYDGSEYVSKIAYNAKGQRILIAFGNDVMTRYTYDNQTFRLERQRSEKFTYLKQGNNITYNYQSGTNKQDERFQYDLIGNILKIIEQRTDCGISGSQDGSDKLQRNFTYDPLYRVTSATGRESDTENQNDYLYSDGPIPGSPNADNVRAYTRKYSYDKLGNIQRMQQVATGNSFAREFNYNSSVNTLADIKTGSGSLIQDFSYDAVGNQLEAGSNRHYLWNAANQLLVYKNQAGTSDPTIYAQYSYGGDQRVSKMVRTGTASNPIYERTIYIDGIFEYHILENDTDTYEKNYVHVMDDRSRIAMVRIGDKFPDDIDEAITYTLENQINSSVARLTTNATVIDREEYYPFGDSSLRTFTKKRYRYTGKEKDIESGLYYYGARYYAPWTCRFISVDPLANDYPFYTPYNYAGNKPINKRDIDGLQEEGNEGNSKKNNSNITNSEANDKIPTVNQSQIPKGSKPLNKGAALHSVKNNDELHKEGRLVKVENPGGGHFYYSTPESNSTGEITSSEVGESTSSKQQVKINDEVKNIEGFEEISKSNNYEGGDNTSNTPSEDTQDVHKATQVGSTMTEKIADRQLKENKTVLSRKQNLKSNRQALKVKSLKSANKVIKSIARFAKGFGLGLSIPDLIDTGKQIIKEFKNGVIKASTIARGIIEFVSAATKASITGIAISISIAAAKASGLLDDFYQYIDKKLPPITF